MIKWRYGLYFVLGGALLLFIALYFGEREQLSSARLAASASTGSPATGSLPLEITLTYSLILLGQAVGITCIGFGLLDVVVGLKNWTNYFEERIKDIVIQQDYLTSLDGQTLDGIQTNVLKARFRDPNIDREGSFLSYFYQTLNKYIAEPYREDATCEIICEGIDAEGIKILDKISYICRKSVAGIQKNVHWRPDFGEFVKVQSLSVSIKYPYSHEKQGQIVSLWERKDLSSKSCEEIVVDAPLDAYKDIDQLIVIVESHYVVAHDRFQYWQMTHPTKNFEITITFPAEYDIQLKPLVLNENLCQKTYSDGYAKVKYDSWMLPMSGLAWRIYKKRRRANEVSTAGG